MYYICTLQLGEEWRHRERERGEAVTSHTTMVFEDSWVFLQALSFLITLSSVRLTRSICDGITITYRRYIHLSHANRTSLLMTLGTIHWRGTAKWNDTVETSARPSDE